MNLWLAPLHGITHYVFRNTLCRHFAGMDFFITPFLPVQEKAKLNVRNWKDIWPKYNTACPTIPQLMGNQPSHFVDTMNLIHDTHGYEAFNWNIGCPVAQVVRRRRGCGIMPYADRVEEVVAAVCGQTPFRFSLKMRLGMHHPDEGLCILERLQDYPLDFVVIHPRLGEQMYEGVPDLDAFDSFYQLTRHRIIYSGDLFSMEDYERLQRRYPNIHDWMLGRGILRNPFLAEEIKGISTGDRQTRFSRYYQLWVEELLQLRGEPGTLRNLKELWHYYRHWVGLDDEACKQLLRINTFSDFMDRSLHYIADAMKS